MSSTLQIGPLALPLAPLLLLAGVLAALALGRRWGRALGLDAEPLLWRLLGVGFIAARLGFVWTWRSVYAAAPWTAFDLRDGGWTPAVGFAAAALVAVGPLQRQPRLRKPVFAAGLLVLLAWTAGELSGLAGPGDARAQLPTLTLTDLAGREVALGRFSGRPTVLNLWATWCPPCQRELPLLQQAQAARADLHFVFVDQGETRDTVARYLQSRGIGLQNVLLDPRRASGAAFDESALPTTLFFDAQGRWVATRVGALSAATLAQQLAALAPAQPGSAPAGDQAGQR